MSSPCVKTRGDKRGPKGKTMPVRESELPSGPEKDRSPSDTAAITAKLDVIMERLQKLELLDQQTVQVASLSRSLEYCHATIADLKAENGALN